MLHFWGGWQSRLLLKELIQPVHGEFTHGCVDAGKPRVMGAVTLRFDSSHCVLLQVASCMNSKENVVDHDGLCLKPHLSMRQELTPADHSSPTLSGSPLPAL